jgi:hypothetical protein
VVVSLASLTSCDAIEALADTTSFTLVHKPSKTSLPHQMVSFNCDNCQETVKKPRLDQHSWKCQASFTCIDCSKTFYNSQEWKDHTSCISEAQKYQKALYKGPQAKPSTETKSESKELEQPKKMSKRKIDTLENEAVKKAKVSPIIEVLIPTIKTVLGTSSMDMASLKKRVGKKIGKATGVERSQVGDALDRLVFQVKGDDIIITLPSE